MKKLFLTAAIAVFSFGAVNAQDDAATTEGFSFGAKAGVNLSNITGDFTDDYSMKVGFHVGGVALFMFNEKMGIQGELLYSTQGAEYEETYTGGSYESTVKLDYLNIPFSFKYFIANGFNVAAGPQVSILLSAKEDWEDTYNGETESGEEDRKDYTTPIDFGFNIGAGYKMDNGLTFDARYNIGFVDINDFTNVNVEEFNQRNSVIQVSVGYMF